MGRKISEKILKILMWMVIVFVALDILLVTLLFVPPVQKMVVNAATHWLSNKTGSKAYIEKIYITPGFKLKASGVVIEDHQQNPMIAVEHLKGRILLHRCSGKGIAFGEVIADSAQVILRKYDDGKSTNISVWSQGFKKKDKKKKEFSIVFDRIVLKNSLLLIANDKRCKHYPDNRMDFAKFEMKNLNLDADDFAVVGADISCKINALTYEQYTGFAVREMYGNFRINNNGLTLDNAVIKTDYSNIDFDFAFRYDSFKSYKDFVDSVHFDVNFRTTQLDMKDIQFYVPSLKGMDNNLVLNGKVKGPIQNMHLKDFYVKYGAMTQLSGEFALEDVIHFKQGCYKVNLTNSNLYMDDLADFKLPGGKTINLPQMVQNLGNVRLNLDFCGDLPQLYADARLKTHLGNVDVRFEAQPNLTNSKVNFSGKLSSSKFDVGEIVNQTKVLGNTTLNVAFSGITDMPNENKNLMKALVADVKGKIKSVNLCNYNLKNIDFNAHYKNKVVEANVTSPDENCNFEVDGSVNFSGNLPQYQASLSIDNFLPYNICKNYPFAIDSAHAKGIEKWILISQNNPTFNLNVNSLDFQLEGNSINNLMGYLNADKVNFQNNKIDAHCEWIHFLSIDPSYGKHNYVLSTDFMDMNFSTNHSLNDLTKVLKEYAAYYFPQFIKSNPQNLAYLKQSADKNDKFVDFAVNLEYIQSFLDVFMPALKVDKRVNLEAYLTDNHANDDFLVDIPSLSFNDKIFLSDLYLTGKKQHDESLQLSMDVDTFSLKMRQNVLPFQNVKLKAHTIQDKIYYNLSWISPEAISSPQVSRLNGYVGGVVNQNVNVKIEESELYLKDTRWTFIGNDLVSISPQKLRFDHCVLAAENVGSIALDGEYSTVSEAKLNVMIDHVDISLLNTFIGGKSTSFGGNLSAIAFLNSNQGKGTVMGKVMASDFVFNDMNFGNIFLLADARAGENPQFFGGIYQPDSNQRFRGLQFYNYSDYQLEDTKLAMLFGEFNAQKKELAIKANIDTLSISFLKPFLASFSNNVYGDAYGELNFVVNKDSLYFDGDVMVREGFLNIAPLNTVYKLENQKITLNPQGIFFDNIRLRDKDYNLAFLDGAVYHNKFRDFRLNLHINSDRIMALNTPKTTDVSFCGDGYVSGNIYIVGDTKKLRFYGDDLKTLSGSQLIFPVSSASKVSTSDGIRFKASLNEAQVVPTKRQSSTEMDYDFTFDVTQDANVRIDLDVIDGTLACKTNGKLRLTYNSTKSLNLDGMLTVASGSFNMSLRNLVPREFDIVEGGTINFTGPLSSSIVDVTARYVKNTSLNNISNQLNIGRTEVNAFLNLDGSLLNPQPSFSFSFPKLNSEEQANVYAALDTSNTQNVLRQFFSLVFFNSFVAGEAQTGSLETQGLQGGIGMVADLFNNFLSQQFKNFDLGLNYYSSDANYREYSVNASIPLYNDRILVKTRFGLAENVSAGTSGNNNNLVGDVSFEYKINEAGNWVLRLFYFNDQYELNQDASRPQQGGGVALIFQQEFNGKQDLIEAWRLHAFGPSRKSKKGKNYEY